MNEVLLAGCLFRLIHNKIPSCVDFTVISCRFTVRVHQFVLHMHQEAVVSQGDYILEFVEAALIDSIRGIKAS